MKKRLVTLTALSRTVIGPLRTIRRSSLTRTRVPGDTVAFGRRVARCRRSLVKRKFVGKNRLILDKLTHFDKIIGVASSCLKKLPVARGMRGKRGSPRCLIMSFCVAYPTNTGVFHVETAAKLRSFSRLELIHPLAN